jgi:hypothetical protein
MFRIAGFDPHTLPMAEGSADQFRREDFANQTEKLNFARRTFLL